MRARSAPAAGGVVRDERPAAVLAPPGVPLDVLDVDARVASRCSTASPRWPDGPVAGAPADRGLVRLLGDVGALGEDRRGEAHDLVDRRLGRRGDRSGLSPDRIRAWMSRGRRTLSI